MLFFDAPVDPVELTTFIRRVPTPDQLALTALFGAPKLHRTNTINFAEIVQTNRTARYRSFDGRIHVSSRDTGSEKYVNLAPLSTSLSKGELERLQMEFANTGGTNVQALKNAVYDDATNLTLEIHNRLEQAWGDVLTDGKLTINENGFMSEADYGIPAGHLITAGTAWTTLTAPALTDLIAAVDVYVATNGFLPGSMQTSQRVQRLLQQNTSIINAIAGAAATRSRVNQTELADLLSSECLPRMLAPYDTQLDIDGTTTRVITDDKIRFYPPNISDLGHTAMGVTATALELVNSKQAEFSFEQAAGIVGVVEKAGPPYREFVFVDAVGMPVLTNAKLLLVLDVI